MPTFDEKIRQKIWDRYNHVCANHKDPKCKINIGLSIHHIIHNTKPNQKLFGDKLQSIDNGILLCGHCHANYSTINLVQTKLQDLKTRWTSIK